MIDPSHIPPIADEELLARFIVNGNEMRADGTVRPQLFLPYKRVTLSVNRLRDASPSETWTIGQQVAAERGKTLYGRVDLRAKYCRHPPLDVIPQPILPHNPNHADIVGYPERKDEQLSLAVKLAAVTEGKWQSPPPIASNDGSNR